MLAHKDARSIVLRTVFGKVNVPSPRLWACNCAAKQVLKSVINASHVHKDANRAH